MERAGFPATSPMVEIYPSQSGHFIVGIGYVFPSF
jgi:hypothetical protein